MMIQIFYVLMVEVVSHYDTPLRSKISQFPDSYFDMLADRALLFKEHCTDKTKAKKVV